MQIDIDKIARILGDFLNKRITAGTFVMQYIGIWGEYARRDWRRGQRATTVTEKSMIELLGAFHSTCSMYTADEDLLVDEVYVCERELRACSQELYLKVCDFMKMKG